jgi:hypothetical protein
VVAITALLIFVFGVASRAARVTGVQALWGKCALAAIALLAFSVWMTGCGGGGSGGDPASVAGTPAGTYSLTLTGMSPNTTAEVTLTLTVH